ncbi:MAG: tetratricopeptide repeat protein [Accumulibacter sp.]|jgi:tetratricopeptide (TPR) repeat protein|uniref:tetratricopeptide repeat protein n=1 Tax=Accumulibacter sp. TaxID=2053492 RepID=UPI002FC2BDA9
MLSNLRYTALRSAVVAASSLLLSGPAPAVPLTEKGAIQSSAPGGTASPYDPAIAKAQGSLDVIRQHRSLLKSGDGARADDKALAWLAKHPDDRIVKTYLARSYLKRERERDAIKQYEALLSRIPDEQEALNNLAVLYQRTGDPRAVTMAQKVYSLKPDSATYADTLGWILVQQGETAKGLKLLEQAVAGAQQDPEIRLHWAQALVKDGQGAKAREALGALKGMKLNPEQASQRQKLLYQLR